MLALDDLRWDQLQHAYGPARDIPELLKTLRLSAGPKTNHQDEPWFSLWSSLCHQGDIYTASFAAVPHIVGIATETTTLLDCSFFQFPAAVEIARVARQGPDVPDFLAVAYRQAILNLDDCVNRHRQDRWDKDTFLSAMAAQAASRGYVAIAEAVLNLDDFWVAKINEGDFD